MPRPIFDRPPPPVHTALIAVVDAGQLPEVTVEPFEANHRLALGFGANGYVALVGPLAVLRLIVADLERHVAVAGESS